MKTIASKLRKIWYSDTPLSVFNPLVLVLSLFSLPYRVVVNVRNRIYDLGILTQIKLPCKVISVGNITVGGTGKTPMVIMLAKLLKGMGYRPAILSRGYGGKSKSPVNIVSDGSTILTGHSEAGDEPILIAQSAEGIPVITGPERTVTGDFAVKTFGADVLILDDAFQHRRIFRDIDIVLLNREKPFGNGYLLPKGPLRESPRGLNRAHLRIWKDSARDGRYPLYCEQGIGTFSPVLSGYLRPKDLVRGNIGEPLPLEYVGGKKICAFAGIGSPENFRVTIDSLGGVLVGFLPYPDHYRFTLEDVDEIRREKAASGAEILVTTEKDGIRLTEFTDFLKEVLILRVEMEMLPSRDEFTALLLEKLK